jgi:hypothetical protein
MHPLPATWFRPLGNPLSNIHLRLIFYPMDEKPWYWKICLWVEGIFFCFCYTPKWLPWSTL